MILQYRLPRHIPGLGDAGDIIVIDAKAGTVEVVRALETPALPTLADVLPQLQPVATSIPMERAVAIVESLYGRRSSRAPRIDVDAALQRLENGAALPEEPRAYDFVGYVPRYVRWYRATDRLNARRNREKCQTVPKMCVCGVTFFRTKINQRRCPSCIAKPRSSRGRKP